MKATTIIIAAVLSLQVSVLFADNDKTRSTVNNETLSINISTLAPVTPAEATFEDATETTAFSFDLSVLTPVTPKEADFSDVIPESSMTMTNLAPVTPSEADFSDNTEDHDFSALAPLAPAGAEFE